MTNTILAIGAAGEEVDRLSSLLGALGVRVAETGKTLDTDMMTDVQKAKDWLGIEEPAFEGVKGNLVGDATWKGLELAAKRALGLSPVESVPPQPPAGSAAAQEEPSQAAQKTDPNGNIIGSPAGAAGDTEETPPASGRFAQSQA